MDSVGVWTIGYGHTSPNIGPGLKISKAYAEELLRRRLDDEFELIVNRLVTVGLTQNQFDALVSFVYNIGIAAFSNSTLLKKLNAGDYAGAADEFDKWHKPKEIIGRRNKEKAMFNGH